MSQKVVITGASGLLGRALLKEFSSDKVWETLGLAYSRTTGGLKKLDLTNAEETSTLLQEYKPKLIIHSAAERRPDVVDKEEDKAKALNVDATKHLCEEAVKIGATVVYISTDYVFDGKNPPYKPEDKPNPLNKYGLSKLEGEKVVLNVAKDNMILRVPLLYGKIENLDESSVTALFKIVQDTSNPCKQCDYLRRRYPTLSNDVASVLNQLLKQRIKDSTLTGIFHWSGDEMMTKYDMAVTIANVFNHSANHIQGGKQPSSGATRPNDSHLDTSRIEKLKICTRTPFRNVIKEILEPFKNTKT